MARTYPLARKPQCKNLLLKYDFDELSALIASGNFNDINIGDYMEVEMTTNLGTTESPNNVTEKVRWLVADMDYFLHTGDTEITAHHLVLIPENQFVTSHQMNTTADTTGAYASSNMVNVTIPKYVTAIETAFGSSHVFSHREILTNSISATAVNSSVPGSVGQEINRTWYTVKLVIPNEVQICGTKVCINSGYVIGANKAQFKLFREMPELIVSGKGFNKSVLFRNNCWVNGVVSTTNFACFMETGEMFSDSAELENGLRPYFLFR